MTSAGVATAAPDFFVDLVDLFPGPFAGIAFLLLLKLMQVAVQPIEPHFPEPAIVLYPIRYVAEWRGFQAGGPPLRFAAARDEAGRFQNGEMPRDGGKADPERFRQFLHWYFAFQGQLSENGAARGVGERGENNGQAILSQVVNLIVN